MNGQSKNMWTLRRLLREADIHLQQIECCRFSEKAKIMLRRRISKNIKMLILTSVRLAKNEGLDETSGKHVILADNLLMHSASRRFFRHLGTIGGIIWAASLSALLAMLSSDKFSILALLIPVGLSIIGTFMITIPIAKDS